MQITCNMRTSVYKNKIIDILQKNHLMSISDIHKGLPDADFSTIFRNINSLCEIGKVKKITLDKDVVVYELVDGHSHDHFMCDDCGRIESIHLERKIKVGNNIVKDILFRGTCEECKD